MHVRQQYERAFTAASADEIAEGVEPRRVDGGHVSHAEDQDLRLPRNLREPVLEGLRRAEEEWPADLVHLDAGRHLPPLNRVRVSLVVIRRIGKLMRQHPDV